MFDQCMYLINGKRAYFVKLTSFTAVNVSFQYFADMLPTYWRYAWRIFFFWKNNFLQIYRVLNLAIFKQLHIAGGYTVSLACSQFLVSFVFFYTFRVLRPPGGGSSDIFGSSEPPQQQLRKQEQREMYDSNQNQAVNSATAPPPPSQAQSAQQQPKRKGGKYWYSSNFLSTKKLTIKLGLQF